MTSVKLDPQKVEEVADKAPGFLSAAGVSGLVYLGDRLGLYRALSESGPSTSGQLAAKTGFHERWVRKWPHVPTTERSENDESGRHAATVDELVLHRYPQI